MCSCYLNSSPPLTDGETGGEVGGVLLTTLTPSSLVTTGLESKYSGYLEPALLCWATLFKTKVQTESLAAWNTDSDFPANGCLPTLVFSDPVITSGIHTYTSIQFCFVTFTTSFEMAEGRRHHKIKGREESLCSWDQDVNTVLFLFLV